jgi:uncharacterized HAD superfamily protein
MKVAVDIDNVLADFAPHLMRFHNKNYGTHFNYENQDEYDLTLYWACSEEETLKRIYAFYDSQEFENIEPVSGAVDAIIQLKNKHELFVITARPYYIEDKTLRWINTYFPNSFKQVVHTNLVSEEGSKHKKKSEVCKELHTQIIIEDCIDYALDCLSAGVTAYLLERPWNKEKVLQKDIKRASTWKEITQSIGI